MRLAFIFLVPVVPAVSLAWVIPTHEFKLGLGRMVRRGLLHR
jgi:hypothetical protein